MIEESLRALRRTPSALLLFIGIYVPVSTTIGLIGKIYIAPQVISGDYVVPEVWINAFRFGTDLLQAAVIALAQTLAFTRLAREIDKPLWKVENDREALRRYYQLWLIIDLAIIVLIRIVNMAILAGASEALTSVLLYLYFFVTVTSVPVGAAIMFYGPVTRDSIRMGLRTLSDEFAMTLGILLFAFALIIVAWVLYLNEATPLWGYPLIETATAIGDCIIFGCAFQLCRIHRERADDDDIDF